MLQCAFKIERTLEAKTLKAEARVLKSLQPCSHVVRLVEQGSIDGRCFMVMEVRLVYLAVYSMPCCVNKYVCQWCSIEW